MGDLDRNRFLQIGLHGSATDFTGAPTFSAIEMQSGPAGPPENETLERDLSRADNMDYADIVGRQKLDDLPINVLVRGLSGNVGAAIAHLTAQAELGLLLDAVSSAPGTDPAGAATAVTGGSGAGATLNVTTDANMVNGGGVMFQLADGTYAAREQLSKAANVLTLDRIWAGASPGADAIPYRSCHWEPNPAVLQHVHLGIREILQSDDHEITWLGCGIQSWSISGGEGKPVMFSSKWKPTSWSKTAVNPAFSAPLAGDYVVSLNSRLFVGGDSAMFKSWSIDGGYVVIPRDTSSAPNGVNGYIVRRKSPSFKGRCYFGTGGLSFGEIAASSGNISADKMGAITDSSGVALSQGKAVSTYDCALQIGAKPGGCIYTRFPATQLSRTWVNDNGVEMIDVVGKARRPASGMPMRIHLF